MSENKQRYKTTMPYVLTATHTGWSKAWGELTGKKVQYHGIANCFVKKNVTGGWQYTSAYAVRWQYTCAGAL